VALLKYKRDLTVAVVTGILIEFVLWLLFYLSVTGDPPTIDQFMWLDRLQQPARTIGLAVWRGLYGRFGSNSTRVWIGSICGFFALIAAWSTGVFIFLNAYRFVRVKSK
jgi:hypothetical protein